MIGADGHPDYEVQDTEFFHEVNTQHAATATSYRRTEPWDANEIRTHLVTQVRSRSKTRRRLIH